MAIYKCKLCGWKYNEDKEGKSWNEVDDDFKCPICHASKDRFAKIN